MNTNDAKEYLARRDIPQLFESLLNGLMCSKPEDPIEYLESCLQKVKELGGCDKVKWDTFVSQEKKTLPPLNGGQSRRSFLRNVLPENSNFPYRRYDRLPPIHQFSIESDTDLSETAELIEEYEVFDPTRPRPKIILVIGGPGSGKGTQSLKIAERYGFQYISVGELLRKKIHSASSNRKWSLIAKIITNGELAPQETTITEIKQRLMQIPDEEGIVIDGFPRDVAQALSFEDQICTPDLVVFLACANQRLKERLQKRAEQQGRPDDNLKATQRRLVNFKQNAGPLVKYFQEKGLIVTFDADRDEDAVFCDISMAVDNKLFPNKEAVTDTSELDPLMFDAGDIIDTGSDCDNQGEDQLDIFGEDIVGGFVEDLRKCKIIFLMGGPGSGKGTQCEKLVEKYGFTHLSTGELLRQELASESERSKLIRDIMERGDLVPSGVILELLKEAMVASLGNTKGFLIDGYPREVKQGQEFGRRIREPHLVICMDCSADTMTSRLLQREQSGRHGEDTANTIARRLEAYHRASIPVVAYYETKTQLWKVNAEGTPDQVFLQLCTAIESVF
ncbi:adenylate kinase isoenzyme 5 isoform X1 [Meriones unguiculatus]|uniref:adenylate kinase isoenzyme 5 isoform X1 n=1 Tax=Meriones unguiculatus TaxID=10047 RepID=UPI00293E5DCF|nr:adenylate kinase isoenzyme 5 isoform X1 [Meriones unguiculatus]